MNKTLNAYLYSSVSVLLALTILFASFFERYSIDGNDKIVNGDFDQGLLAWKTSKQGVSLLSNSDKGVQLTNSTGLGRIHVSQNIKLNSERFVKLSGLLRTSEVIEGNRKWKAGRLAAVQNRIYPYGTKTDRTVIFTQSGTSDWKKVSRVFEIQDNTESVDIVFELIRAKGSAAIHNISLVEVFENQSFIFLRACLRISWLLLVLLVVWKCINQPIVIATAIVILTGILLTANAKSALGAQLGYWLIWDPGSRSTSSELVFTAGHLLGFWILSMATLFQTRSLRTSYFICLNLLLFAACTEIVQLLSEDRNASFPDGITDTVGILGGWVVWKFTRHRNIMEK